VLSLSAVCSTLDSFTFECIGYGIICELKILCFGNVTNLRNMWQGGSERMQVYEWHECFHGGSVIGSDDPRCWWWSALTNDENVKLLCYWQKSIQEISVATVMSLGSIFSSILHQVWLCIAFMSTWFQKETQITPAGDMLTVAVEDVDFLSNRNIVRFVFSRW
jgi:hypothetical protein